MAPTWQFFLTVTRGEVSNPDCGRRYSIVPPILEMISEIPTVAAKPRAGDIDSLFAEHYAAVTRLIYRVVGDTGWAEELASEAFWKLHRDPPRSDRNLVGWLYRTGLRLALDNLKMRKRRAHYESRAPGPVALATPEEAAQ